MNIYEFKAMDLKGREVALQEYAGKVMLIVNTATKCGFTPQYKELQELHEKYYDQGLRILDFPCNQFGQQAPGSDEEIASFCDLNYGISFERFKKIEVNGANALPLFTYLQNTLTFKGFDPKHELTQILDKMLKEQDADYMHKPDIKWNFTKFLINRDGVALSRFEPTEDMAKVEEAIKALL